MPDAEDLNAPLYRRIVGPCYAQLPEVTRALHDVRTRVVATGHATVTHGDNPVARALAWALGFPAPVSGAPITVTVTVRGGVENLSRHYPDATLTTEQRAGTGVDAGRLIERMGPAVMVLALEPHDEGLDFTLERVRVFGVTLPRWMRPRVTARERAVDGRHGFYVCVALPGLGRLIRYEGLLAVERESQDGASG